MPLDVEPVAPIVFRDQEEARKGIRGLQVFIDKAQIRSAGVDDLVAGTPLYRPHWATCPDADRFRR